MPAALEQAGGEKCAAMCREAFHWLGVQDVTEFCSDLCSVFACLEKKERGKKREREMARGLFFFFTKRDTPCWLDHVEFSWLLGADKG
jgi:hypothetical protein